MNPLQPCTVFQGHRQIASGPLHEIALKVQEISDNQSLTVYDDLTGRVIDIDLRGTPPPPIDASEPAIEARGPGRPRLGVIAKEVTLLPRHWDWLNTQPGGASVTLRKLVEEARRVNGDRDRQRQAQEATYRFLSAIAGDLPGFEEINRALFAYDRSRFTELLAPWPEDVRNHALKLAFTQS
jgi:hypothetical protein